MRIELLCKTFEEFQVQTSYLNESTFFLDGTRITVLENTISIGMSKSKFLNMHQFLHILRIEGLIIFSKEKAHDFEKRYFYLCDDMAK